MSAQPLVPPFVPPPSSGRFVRVEYVDFQNVAEHREYRFRGYGADGWAEFRLRIAVADFGAGRVRLQDGPDVCYQKLLWVVAGGETPGADVITIDEADLASYREAHTLVPKRRSFSAASPPTPTPAIVPQRQPRTPSPRLPFAPPLVTSDTEPSLEQGQRVSHAVFGAGVTASSGGGHTVIRFDEGGPKTFVTSLLEVDVLSAPHAWETDPRGNRPCTETVTGAQTLRPSKARST